MPRARRHQAFKSRFWWQYPDVLQNEATGLRVGMLLANAAAKVLLIDAMWIMVRPMSPAGHGCMHLEY